MRREIPAIAAVLGTALLFAILFNNIRSLGADPDEQAGAAQYQKAQAVEKSDPQKAIDLYSAIGTRAGRWHELARAQVVRLRTEAASRAPQPSSGEQKDFEALREFWRQHPMDHDGLIRMGEAFVAAHPRGDFRPEVERLISESRRLRVEARAREVEEIEIGVNRLLEKRDFGAAILAIEKASGRLRPELELWSRLAARRDAVVAEALRHYRVKLEEADRLVKQGRRDAARDLWYSTIHAFGDRKVAELADLCDAATLRAEEIAP